jgi:hypothetical protein
MPIGSISVTEASEIVATTLRSATGKLADNTSNNNPVRRRLKTRGKIKPWRGGYAIRQEIHYSGNTTWTRYTHYDPLNVTPSETIGSYEYDPKFATIAVTISGQELLMNSGEAQIIDLLEGRIENAMAEGENQLDADMCSAGTASGGKQIGGLQLLVASDPTSGIVGGVDRATYSIAQNKRYRALTTGSAIKSASNIQLYMNRLHLLLVRGSDAPDIVLMSNEDYAFYEVAVQTIQRITESTMGDLGFHTYKYKGADVVPNGQGGNIPANLTYMLNTRHLFLRPHEDRDLEQIGGDRVPVNQDASINIIGFAGNMTCDWFPGQGVLTND